MKVPTALDIMIHYLSCRKEKGSFTAPVHTTEQKEGLCPKAHFKEEICTD